MTGDARGAAATVRRSTVLLALSAALLLGNARPAAAEASEYAVKAAFLLNFARLIEWPATAFPGDSAPLVLGTLGPSHVDGEIRQALVGKHAGRRPLRVIELSNAEQVADCHMIFVSADAPNAQLVRASRGQNVLTVGDDEDFARNGGVIGFYRDGKRLRFEINTGAADAAELRVSSRLLGLARLVASEGSGR
jgi:hypothetical protein